jgi:anti-sigma B factor antagonist
VTADIESDQITGTDGASEVVVGVNGAVERDDVRRLRETLVPLSSASRRTLVLDLSRVDFLDSSVVPLLIALRRRCAAAGGGLLVRRPSAVATRFLESTKLHRVLAVDRTPRS